MTIALMAFLTLAVCGMFWWIWHQQPGPTLAVYAYDSKWKGRRPVVLTGSNPDGTVNAVVFLDSQLDVEFIKFARFPVISLERCILTDNAAALSAQFGDSLTTCLVIEPADDPRMLVQSHSLVASIIAAERLEDLRRREEARRAAEEKAAQNGDTPSVSERLLLNNEGVVPPSEHDEG